MNQSARQSFINNPSAEIPPAQGVYAFKDLPTNVQQNLLRLQNTDDSFIYFLSR